MKERTILMSAPMVRALLEGRKTQTRRAVKHRVSIPPVWATHCNAIQMFNIQQRWVPANLFQWSEEQPAHDLKGNLRRWPAGYTDSDHTGDNYAIPSPYGKPGDRLWVRETTVVHASIRGQLVGYAADGCYASEGFEKTMPSIHMRRAHSRITLEITEVRVHRLQEISEDDAAAEGCMPLVEADGSVTCGRRKSVFRSLWKSINGNDSWDANPWVWAITFKVVQP